MIFGNYAVDTGRILVRDRITGDVADLASGDPRLVLSLRRDHIGYVSQFLRRSRGFRLWTSWPSRFSRVEWSAS